MTLAGTCIKTDLKDLGASISVVTEQFKDVGDSAQRPLVCSTPRWAVIKATSRSVNKPKLLLPAEERTNRSKISGFAVWEQG